MSNVSVAQVRRYLHLLDLRRDEFDQVPTVEDPPIIKESSKNSSNDVAEPSKPKEDEPITDNNPV